MKKLPITKERYEKSRYFNKKYGKLEYVSESGKVFKTEKGKVLMFKESYENVMSIEKWMRSMIKSNELPGVEKFKGGRIPIIKFKGSNIKFNYVLQQIGLDSGVESLWSDETEIFYPSNKLVEKIEDWFIAVPEDKRIDILMDALNKVYDKGGIFGKAPEKKLWLDIPRAIDDGEYILYGKVEIPKIDVISNLAEDYPELDELDVDEQDDWLQSHKKDVAEMIQEMAWTYREYDESSKKFGKQFKESVGDISTDPAYVCPYCGSRDCEFDDCPEIGTQEGYFDGAKFNATWYCKECGRYYNVEFTMNVTDVTPMANDMDDENLEIELPGSELEDDDL